MPTLTRLIAIIATICVLVFGGMIAVVKLVHVERRTIIVDVPLPKPAAKP